MIVGLLHPGEMGSAIGAAVTAYYGVEAEWRVTAPELVEIADTFAAAGGPDGFHGAAAEVFRA